MINKKQKKWKRLKKRATDIGKSEEKSEETRKKKTVKFLQDMFIISKWRKSGTINPFSSKVMVPWSIYL